MKATLNNTELAVLNARLTGVSFCQIDDFKKSWHIDQIMLKAAAIAGCSLPNTDFFANVIAEELTHFILNLNKGELTYEEILLSLRLNSTGGYRFPSGLEMEQITFFGNCFNIDYFSKVAANYMLVRNQLDRKLQNFIDGY